MMCRVYRTKESSYVRLCYRRAEAEVEVDVTGNLQDAFTKAWQVVKDQVKQQLKPEETGLEPPW